MTHKNDLGEVASGLIEDQVLRTVQGQETKAHEMKLTNKVVLAQERMGGIGLVEMMSRLLKKAHYRDLPPADR
jgi:hypothetical protein